MTVIYPQQTVEQIGMAGSKAAGEVPVLYLLHGLSDDDTIWGRRTSVERYAAELGIAIVMPQVHRSFYSNQVHGLRYWDYISEEVPKLVQSMFNVSTKREHTFVAGLSMGGYGAMKLGLRHPERFAAVGSFSGCLAMGQPGTVYDYMQVDFPLTFGPNGNASTPDDPLHLLQNADKSTLPKLMVTCGTEDFLWDENQQFIALAKQRGIDLELRLAPGEHNWEFWDADIQAFFKWIEPQLRSA